MHAYAARCASKRGALPDVVACHCSQCRKQTGFHYATTDVQISNFTVVGDDQISWYRASPTARRGFCRTCGSALFWVADDADRIAVMAGLFDAPGALKMGYHIFCADKADFYEISDGLPQLPQGR